MAIIFQQRFTLPDHDHTTVPEDGGAIDPIQYHMERINQTAVVNTTATVDIPFSRTGLLRGIFITLVDPQNDPSLTPIYAIRRLSENPPDFQYGSTISGIKVALFRPGGGSLATVRILGMVWLEV